MNGGANKEPTIKQYVPIKITNDSSEKVGNWITDLIIKKIYESNKEIKNTDNFMLTSIAKL